MVVAFSSELDQILAARLKGSVTSVTNLLEHGRHNSCCRLDASDA